MAPTRVTRSANKSLPRKRYDRLNDNASTASASNAKSMSFPSDNEEDEDISADLPRASPKLQKRTSVKRKPPLKARASTAGRKRTASGMPPPAKKRRTTDTPKESLNTPNFNWTSKWGTPLPDLPEPPPAIANDSLADWTEWGNQVRTPRKGNLKPTRHSQGQGDAQSQESGPSDEDTAGALAAIHAELALRQSRKAPMPAPSEDRTVKEKSIEWPPNDAEDDVEEREEVPASPNPLLAEQRLRQEQLSQERLNRQRQVDSESEEPQSPSDEERAIRAQLEPDQESRPTFERGNTVGFENWVANDLAMPGSTVAPSSVVGDPDVLEEDHPAADLVNDQNEAPTHSNEDEDDFDVDFSEHQGQPHDVYEVEASDHGDQNPEGSLFVAEAQQGDSEEEREADPPPESPSRRPGEPDGAGRPYKRQRVELVPVVDIEDDHDQGSAFGADEDDPEQPQTPQRRMAPPEQQQLQSPKSPFAYVRPREDGFKAPVKSQHLEKLLRQMKAGEWTGDGARWEKELLSGYNVHISPLDLSELNGERRKAGKTDLSTADARDPFYRWYNHHRQEVDSGKAREMLQTTYHLWRICRDAPTEEHGYVDYFTRGEGQGFRRAQSLCDKYVGYISSRLNKESKRQWANRLKNSISTRLVPLLVLVLKEAFLMSSHWTRDERGASDDLPAKIQASEFHLQTILTISEWLARLCIGLRTFEMSSPNSPRGRQQSQAISTLETFAESVRTAIQQRKEAVEEPTRKAWVAENDRRIRQRRAVKEQKIRENEARQNQMFQSSLQSIWSQGYEAEASYTARHDFLPSSSYLQSASQELGVGGFSSERHDFGIAQKPARKKLSPKEQYRVENNGFYWHEDYRLLKTLERVTQPNAASLAKELGKTTKQVDARLVHLRGKGNEHYEARKMTVPEWCDSRWF